MTFIHSAVKCSIESYWNDILLAFYKGKYLTDTVIYFWFPYTRLAANDSLSGADLEGSRSITRTAHIYPFTANYVSISEKISTGSKRWLLAF